MKKLLNSLKENSTLWDCVISEILEDAPNYGASNLVDNLIGWTRQIMEYGLSSGLVGSMIYYTDTMDFYNRYKDQVNLELYQMLEDTGLSMQELFGRNFDEEDPLCLERSNQNLLAWFAYERIATELLQELELTAKVQL